MNIGAGVHSLDALKDWSAALIQFREEGQNALTSVALELQRAADWLIEQQHYWRRELRKAEDAVVQAKVELQRKKHTDWLGKQPDITVEMKALAKAIAHQEFIEERIAITKRWVQDLPVAIEDTYDGPSRSLQFFLDIEMARALAHLGRQLDALDQYVAMTPVSAGTPQEAKPQAAGETP